MAESVYGAQRGVARLARIAVIDIGSNTIRLVVYDRLARTPAVIGNEKVTCALGRGVAETGQLNPGGVELALANIERFMRLVRVMEVRQLDVLATAAVREASDGPAFCDAVATRCGQQPRVLSGSEEARRAAQGVASGIPDADGIMGDLGGGSLELVGLNDGCLDEDALVSLTLGPLPIQAEVGHARKPAKRLVDSQLDSLAWLSAMAGRSFYCVGGAWRAIAKAHMIETRHPLHIVQQYEVSAEELRQFAKRLAKTDPDTLAAMPGIPRRRAPTMPQAALVLERLIRKGAPRRVVFSQNGLREGQLFGQLDAEAAQQDPLLATCADIAHALDRFADAEAIQGFTRELFTDEGRHLQRLRQAACLLSDICWLDSEDYQPSHAYLRVLRLPFSGINHADRAFLALALYARYAGNLNNTSAAPARSLVAPEAAQRALSIGLALRLAHTLTSGAFALLERIALRREGGKLWLILPPDEHALAGEVVDRRLEALAKTLNLGAETVVLEDAPVDPVNPV